VFVFTQTLINYKVVSLLEETKFNQKISPYVITQKFDFMKKNLLSLILLTLAICCTSCDWFDSNKEPDNEIGGSSNIAINTVGNTFSSSISVDGKYVTTDASIKIIESVNGVNTMEFKVDLSKVPSLAGLNAIIPGNLKDSSGKLNFTTKVKMTDEGILDYSNSDEAPFVAVRYDSKVGDKYTLTKSNGETITRTVVRKSTTDDYYWGGMIIKTIDVEQTDCYPGIKKYQYFFNHKFGVVGVVITTEDGSELRLGFVPTTY